MTSKNILKIRRSTQLKKDLKKAIKQDKNLKTLETVVELVIHGKSLPPKYCDHTLGGRWRGYHECHIEPDWLLIYKITRKELILYLARTGSHSELFKM